MSVSTSKILRPIDYRSTAGIMLRGRNVYRGGSHVANPHGINTKKAATGLLKRRGRA